MFGEGREFEVRRLQFTREVYKARSEVNMGSEERNPLLGYVEMAWGSRAVLKVNGRQGLGGLGANRLQTSPETGVMWRTKGLGCLEKGSNSKSGGGPPSELVPARGGVGGRKRGEQVGLCIRASTTATHLRPPTSLVAPSSEIRPLGRR
jgi:hypothetical protein